MRKKIIVMCLFSGFCSTIALASPSEKNWYVSANAGIFQGMYNVKYNDLSDVIPLNSNQTIQQNGYTAGLNIGYTKPICNPYFIGAQLSGNYDSNSSYFGSGSSAFSEKLFIQDNFDLTFVPGLFLNNSIAAYGKIGLSYAHVTSNLTSPSGPFPVQVNSNNIRHVFGGTAGIGIKKFITDNVSIFSEYNYHDYGTINFPNFQNFTATYNHSARMVFQNILIGASYSF